MNKENNIYEMNIQYTGNEMYDLVKDLFPICRSITGDGVRKTLEIIKNYIPIETHEISSGTKVFDWVIPKEWNIKDAYVKNSKGEKIIDFKKSPFPHPTSKIFGFFGKLYFFIIFCITLNHLP